MAASVTYWMVYIYFNKYQLGKRHFETLEKDYPINNIEWKAIESNDVILKYLLI